MQIGRHHLTYCSNIHAGESWEEVRRNLGVYLPDVRRRLGWSGALGVGLRLSAQAAEQLEHPDALAEFQQFLAREQLYVFTINGFPYGVFHRVRVKEEVYLPDWRDPLRLDYTNRLARLLAALLPDDPRLEGSVSTVPGAFKSEVRSADDERAMARQMLRHVAELVRLRESTGRTIALAIEPEPCCYIETIDEAVAFYRDYLLNAELVRELADELGVKPAWAESAIRRHFGLCYDACHMAIEFEEVAGALERLRAAGLKVSKFQISSALKLEFRSGDGRAAAALTPFAESTYLHQVVERSAQGLKRYVDLPEGLAVEATEAARRGSRLAGARKEWRVHFHVPIFLEEMRDFSTTQDHLVELLSALEQSGEQAYLEVETYTWDVLPQEYKTVETAEAIARELSWVRQRIVG